MGRGLVPVALVLVRRLLDVASMGRGSTAVAGGGRASRTVPCTQAAAKKEKTQAAKAAAAKAKADAADAKAAKIAERSSPASQTTSRRLRHPSVPAGKAAKADASASKPDATPADDEAAATADKAAAVAEEKVRGP